MHSPSMLSAAKCNGRNKRTQIPRTQRTNRFYTLALGCCCVACVNCVRCVRCVVFSRHLCQTRQKALQDTQWSCLHALRWLETYSFIRTRGKPKEMLLGWLLETSDGYINYPELKEPAQERERWVGKNENLLEMAEYNRKKMPTTHDHESTDEEGACDKLMGHPAVPLS